LLPEQIEQNNAELATIEQFLTIWSCGESRRGATGAGRGHGGGLLRDKGLAKKLAKQQAKGKARAKGIRVASRWDRRGVPLYKKSKEGLPFWWARTAVRMRK